MEFVINSRGLNLPVSGNAQKLNQDLTPVTVVNRFSLPILPPRLRHHDVDKLVLLRVVVQHELRHLRRLAATGVARDDGHLDKVEEGVSKSC